MHSYRLATPLLRRAAGFVLAAVTGADLGGHYYPGGVVSFGSLLSLWKNRGGDGQVLALAAQALVDSGKVHVDQETGIMTARAAGTSPEGEEMQDRGGYYPEVVPLTTSKEPEDYDHVKHESMLPVGLGGSSAYDWDVFDAWDLDGGGAISVKSHLGRLMGL